MNKRYEDLFQKLIYKNERMPLSFGTLATVAFCLLMLIISTFVRVEIVHPWFLKNPSGDYEIIIKSYPYVPQIPVLLGIVALLGKPFSFLTVIIYIFMGLFIWPIFAMGDGLDYLKTGFFGYILGFVPAIIFAGNILNKGMHIKYVSLAAICGILAMDLTGIFYIAFLALFRLVEIPILKLVLSAFNPSYILYSLLCSIAAIYIGYGARYLLWPMIQTNLRVKKLENVRQKIIEKMEKQEIDEFDIELSKKPTKKKTKKNKEEQLKPRAKRGRPRKTKEDN